jgi:maltose-binding protein MalE
MGSRFNLKLIRTSVHLIFSCFTNIIGVVRLRSKNLCFISIALLGLLSACQSSTPPPATVILTSTTAPATQTAVPTQAPTPTSSVRGKVTLWLSWDPLELATLQQVITVFQERHPEVTFAIAYYPEEELHAAVTGVALEENAPSIFFAPSSWGPQLWHDGVIMDLTTIADVELQATINPLAWSQVAYDSVILGLPIEMLGVFLFRNRSLVQEPAATLDELISVTQQLKDDRDIGAGLDYGFTFSV